MKDIEVKVKEEYTITIKGKEIVLNRKELEELRKQISNALGSNTSDWVEKIKNIPDPFRDDCRPIPLAPYNPAPWPPNQPIITYSTNAGTY